MSSASSLLQSPGDSCPFSAQAAEVHLQERQVFLSLSDFFSPLMSLIDFLSLWLRAWITKFPLRVKVQDTSEISRQSN